MTTFTKRALLNRIANRKNRKQNGFTLIELMVVVAIVGILSGVGLPQLLKAQDKAKDSVAIATLTNAAKECSLLLVTEGNGDNFGPESYSVGDNDLGGTCEVSGDLTLVSESASAPTARITFDVGGIPNPASFDEAEAPVGG